MRDLKRQPLPWTKWQFEVDGVMYTVKDLLAREVNARSSPAMAIAKVLATVKVSPSDEAGALRSAKEEMVTALEESLGTVQKVIMGVALNTNLEEAINLRKLSDLLDANCQAYVHFFFQKVQAGFFDTFKHELQWRSLKVVGDVRLEQMKSTAQTRPILVALVNGIANHPLAKNLIFLKIFAHWVALFVAGDLKIRNADFWTQKTVLLGQSAFKDYTCVKEAMDFVKNVETRKDVYDLALNMTNDPELKIPRPTNFQNDFESVTNSTTETMNLNKRPLNIRSPDAFQDETGKRPKAYVSGTPVLAGLPLDGAASSSNFPLPSNATPEGVSAVSSASSSSSSSTRGSFMATTNVKKLKDPDDEYLS
eukprot:g8044.t1